VVVMVVGSGGVVGEGKRDKARRQRKGGGACYLGGQRPSSDNKPQKKGTGAVVYPSPLHNRSTPARKQTKGKRKSSIYK
jgi:hypothetical protein